MKRLASVLVVLLLAGALYVLLGDDTDPTYEDLTDDPLPAGPDAGSEPLTDGGDASGGGSGDGGPLFTDRPPGDAASKPLKLVLRGRVVDQRRHPVADVKVSVRLGRRSVGGSTSDAGGRYEVELVAGRALRALVVAQAADGRMGTAATWTVPGATGALGVPTIVLRSGTELRVRVVHGPERTAVPGATCVVARRSAGAPVTLGTHRTSGAGQLSVAGLPRGPIEVFASAPGKGRGHARITLPQGTEPPPEIVLGGERRIDVHVIDAVTRRSVGGAEILVGDRLSMPVPDGPGYLPPVGSVRTNASGRATVGGLGATDTIFVNARAPGYVLSPWWKHARAGVEPDQGEVEIALHGFRTVRFPMDAFAPETPADGTALRLELDPQAARTAAPDRRAWIEEGHLLVQGLPDSAVRGTVRAAGGIHATFTAPTRITEGAMVVFRRARTVVVRLSTADGAPAPAVALALSTVPPSHGVLTATTDAGGMASFRDVGGDAAAVHHARGDRRGAGAILAKLDLTEEREAYDVSLLAKTNLLIRMRVEGEPRLPPDYGLTIGGRPVLPEDIVEDPAAGTVVAAFDNEGPKRTLQVRVVPEGFLPVERSLVVETGDVEHEITVDLEAEGQLIAHVTPPGDGQFGLALEMRGTQGTWTHASSASADAPHVAGGSVSLETRRFRGLAAGTYRVRDPRSGVTSAPVRVEPGADARTVTLDLSAVGWVEGRVVAPVGTELRRARVLVEGKDRAGTAWAGAAVKEDGTFRVRADTDRGATLSVTHPTLRPARNGGRVTVRGSGPVELRLERGGEAHFAIRAAREEEINTAGVSGTVSIRLYKGEASGEALHVIRPVKDGLRYRFGGFEPGTYTLWIDIGSRYAPFLKKGVKLGDGTTDLGTIEPDPGATLRVRLRSAGGATRLYVTAVRRDPPTYTRSAGARAPGGEVVCRGLGPGTFSVSVRSVGVMGGGGAGLLYEQDVTLDGRTEKVIEVSAR